MVLMQAYLSKVAQQICAANQLPGMLGVFQKLLSSKALDHEGFNLLDSMMQHVPFATLQQYMPTVGPFLLFMLYMSTLCLKANQSYDRHSVR